MKYLSQLNPEWSAKLIGKTPFTIGRWGCLITCISMLSDYYGVYKDPSELANALTFDKYGRLYWKTVNSVWPKIHHRIRGDGFSATLLRAVLKSDDRSAVLELNHAHWVVAVRPTWYGHYIIVDPIDGRKKSTRVYGKTPITGYSIFQGERMKKKKAKIPFPKWLFPNKK